MFGKKKKRKTKRGSARRGGARLGRYDIVDTLGQGGMGTVYLGHDPVIDRYVAIKVVTLHDDLPEEEAREYRARFLREAKAAGALQHPNIVAVHDIGQDPEKKQPYIVMEHVEGQDLKKVLQKQAPLSPGDAVRMVLQVASALDFAHRRGIVHRDIKPANVLVSERGQVKITDFGVARLPNSDLTKTDQFVGSPGFISPEQLQGGTVDGRSDLFALGVILYQLLTGHSPFQGDSISEVLYRISNQPFEPPSSVSDDVSDAFDPILDKALSKDPAGRYQTGREFMEALLEVQMALEVASEQKPAQKKGRSKNGGSVVDKRAAESGGGEERDEAEMTISYASPIAPSPWLTLNSGWRIVALLVMLVITFIAVNFGIYFLLRGPLNDLSSHTEGAPESNLTSGSLSTASLAMIGGGLPMSGRGEGTPPERIPREAASLKIKLTHSLNSGRLIVTVSGRTALSKPFDAAFDASRENRHDTVSHLLSVPVGRHEVKVEVLGERGQVEGRSRITGIISGDRVAMLSIEQPGGSGRSLTLRWVQPETGTDTGGSR